MQYDIIENWVVTESAGMLYISLIYAHFLCCNFILDGMSQENKDKLTVQQNGALNAVLVADYSIPTSKLYVDADVDTVEVCMKKTTCKIVYRGKSSVGPPVYNRILHIAIPNHDLRSSDVLNAYTPICRTKFGEFNATYRASVYWNQIAVDIQCAKTLDQYKKAINKNDGFG